MTKDQHMSEKVESGLEVLAHILFGEVESTTSGLEIDDWDIDTDREALDRRAQVAPGTVLELVSKSDADRALSQLRSTQEDLELALEDAEMRAESAGRNASAFEERMGDLQVENGRLKDEVQRERERHRKTWRQLEQSNSLLRVLMSYFDTLVMHADTHALDAAFGEDWDVMVRAIRSQNAAALSQQAEPVEQAPAQDERDFWVWLDQAYRDGSKGESPTFTKYNMQVAFKAGAEWQRTRPAQTEQQPKYGTYTTNPGESLMGIANRELRSSDRWTEIRDLNAPAFPDMGPHDYYPVGTVLTMPAAPIAQTAPRPTGLSQGWNLVRQCDGFVIGHSSEEPSQRHKEQALSDGRIYVPFLVVQTAPQPEQSGLVEALENARAFIRNGVDLGFITMPDRDTPDSAHDTLLMIERALATYRAAPRPA